MPKQPGKRRLIDAYGILIPAQCARFFGWKPALKYPASNGASGRSSLIRLSTAQFFQQAQLTFKNFLFGHLNIKPARSIDFGKFLFPA